VLSCCNASNWHLVDEDRLQSTLSDLTDTLCADFSIGGSQLHKFTSPNYPASYPANLDCIRMVQAPRG
jgi:hypothetical protein